MELLASLRPAAATLLAVSAIAALGVLAHVAAAAVVRRLTRHRPGAPLRLVMAETAGPVRLCVALLVFQLFLPAAVLPAGPAVVLERSLGLGLIFGVAWLLIRGTRILQELLLRHHRVDVADNLRARRVETQVSLLRRLVVAVIVVLAFGCMLMVFERVRQLGASILASAGIAGLIVGFAAQRSLATLLAGLQVAVTQPIRIDDVVIVEGEWGRIEEITLTYVVVRIWDRRRLVVPISHFLEEPFQNWTRVSSDLVGTVFLYVDYTVPVEAVREELRRILAASPEWDGEVCALQVTEATDRAVELRALMSAPDASAAWDLRCRVREGLVRFLQANYPGSLPHLRARLETGSAAEEATVEELEESTRRPAR